MFKEVDRKPFIVTQAKAKIDLWNCLVILVRDFLNQFEDLIDAVIGQSSPFICLLYEIKTELNYSISEKSQA
jgi:hypothetical protein